MMKRILIVASLWLAAGAPAFPQAGQLQPNQFLGNLSANPSPAKPTGLGTSVINPGTGKLEYVLPVQTNTVAGGACTTSCTYAAADLFKKFRRSNSGSPMSDTLPAAAATGMVNGTRLTIGNVDATATLTLTAGAGTTIATTSVGPARTLPLVYDLPNTAWRIDDNAAAVLLNSNNLSDVSSPSAAFTNLANVLNTQTANYTVQTSDCGKTIQAGTGSTGFFTVTYPAVSGFPSTCLVTVTNGDTVRGKAVIGAVQTLNCSSQNILWPLQSCAVGIVNGSWTVITRPGRWKPPVNSTLNFFTDFTNGTDTAGATDGLASGAAAFKSVEHCQLVAADQIDFNTASQTQVRCNMAPATADTQGMHTPVHALTGAQGGAAFQVVGASLSVSGAVSNGGLCEITVPSTTSTYSANQVVSVYGIGGATGCNGTWKVTVTDSTHLTLQSTTFGGTYTSGGTVTNGSSFNVSAASAIGCYFGTVMQFYNVTFIAGQSALNPAWGCKIYLQAGNIFGAVGGSDIFGQFGGTQVHFEADIGIAASATNAFAQMQFQSLLISDASININFVPGINPSFSGLGFVYADTQGQANFQNVTINTNGNTVTGQRFQASTEGYINTGIGNGNLTYFPGSVAGVLAGGASYDALGGFAVSGDCTITLTTGGIVCTKTNGTAFTAGATNSPAAEQARLGMGLLTSCVAGVNFNSPNTDTAIVLSMPSGNTRLLPVDVTIDNASHTLVSATFGVFSATAAGGIAIVGGGTAITVSATTDATGNNAQKTPPAATSVSFVAANLATPSTVYFRVQGAAGAAATGDVCFDYYARP